MSDLNIKKILLFIFVFRPIIDLAWNDTLFGGLNLAGIVSILMILLTGLYLLQTKKLKIDGVVESGLFLVAYSFFITLFNFSSFADFDFSLRLLSALCFYIVVTIEIKEEELEKSLKWFMIITLVPIILTYLQSFGLVEYTYFDYINDEKVMRGSGGYHQPSVLTRYCIFGLLYTYYFLEKNKLKGKKSLFLYIYICLNLVAVFLSYHRTAYMLLVLVTLYWFYLQNKGKIQRYIPKIIALGFVAIVVFIGLYAAGVFTLDLDMFKSLLSVDNFIRIRDGKYYLHLRGRGSLIQLLIDSFSDNPWYNVVFGNGVNINKVSRIDMSVADMDFIRILWHVGFVGFVFWIYHIYKLKLNIKKAIKEDVWKRMAKCMFLLFLVWGFTIEATSTPNLMCHIYLICGFALRNSCRQEEISQKKLMYEKGS